MAAPVASVREAIEDEALEEFGESGNEDSEEDLEEQQEEEEHEDVVQVGPAHFSDDNPNESHREANEQDDN